MRNVFIFILMALLSSCKPSQYTIYTIGDSTMGNKPHPETNPERGWVQMLPLFFNDKVTIKNRAVNGRSSKSFRDLGHWKPIYDSLKKGDYVFIQFGHNDTKDTDSTRFTNPNTTYRNNLIHYVQEVREKGAIPILFTSITRRNFNENGVLIDTHGMYTVQTRLVAQEYKVPLVDLQYFTELLELQYGVEGSKKLHLHFAPGENVYYPDGKTDNTHLSELGATEIAKIAIIQFKILKLPFVTDLK